MGGIRKRERGGCLHVQDDQPRTGRWLIEPSDGTLPGIPLSFGDKIYLQSLYPGGGWLDNCGLLQHLPIFQEFAASQQAAFSTSRKHRAMDWTDIRIVRSPPGKTGHCSRKCHLSLGTAFAGVGHLNASGEVSSIEAFSGAGFERISTLIFISNNKHAMDESGQGKAGRTD